MADVCVTLQLPEELYDQAKKAAAAYKSDINTDMVSFLNYYVSTYKDIAKDPAAKIVLGVK